MSYYRGDGRGRHKKRSSPEAKAWREVSAHGWLRSEPARVPAEPVEAVAAKSGRRSTWRPKTPPRPPWLDPDSYEGLLKLRRRLL